MKRITELELAAFAANDWRPLGLGFGFALSAPPVVLPLVAWLGHLNVRECLVSYAIPQRPPIPLISALLLPGVPLVAIGVAKLV